MVQQQEQLCELGCSQFSARCNAHTYRIFVFAFLYLCFCICILYFVAAVVQGGLCTVCAGHSAHTAQCSHGTMHTVRGTRHNVHTAHGTGYTAQCSPNGSIPPSSLQPLSANSSPHIASYPQHQVFQWELSTWTQLEPKRFWHSSFGWGCPSLLSFYVLLKTVESTLIGLSKKGIYFVI